MKTYRIKFIKGALVGYEFPIGPTPMIIGRSRGCDIRIPKKTEFQDVSRRHIMLVNQDDALFIVNMSSHTTLLDGWVMPLNHKARLAAGMKVAIGAATEFCVHEMGEETFEISQDETQVEEELKLFGNTQVTVCGEVTPDRAVASLTSVTMNTPTGNLAVPLTGDLEGEDCDPFVDAPFVADSDVEEPNIKPADLAPPTDVPPGTIPPGTILVSPDELTILVEANRKAKLFKTYKRVGILVGSFIVVAVSYLCMRPHPETELTWPMRPDGKFDDKQIEFKTVLGERAVGILCPFDRRTDVRVDSNDVTVVNTFIGRDRDVPLRLRFSCEKNKDFLKKSRNQLFEEKRRELEETGGWNFMAASPVAFLGPNNGVPYREIQYLRSEKTDSDTLQWFGHLIFVVHGDCILLFTREIPAVEQWRGGAFLARETMLLFGDQIINGHWEGRNDFRDEPIESMLVEADGLLSLRSPLLWKEAEFLLQSVMIKSEGTGRYYDEALKRLLKLRSDQCAEFNRLKALANKEKVLGKSNNDTSPALEEALRVFSSSDDKRNIMLKKGRWE